MRQLRLFLEAIKFTHSIFALPFALVAMLLAADGFPGWAVFGWIFVACVAARTAAMSFNRLADRRFDAENPRTAGRALVTGDLSAGFMSGALLLSSAIFFLAAAMLNTLCLILAGPTLLVLFGYSLTKRFTHFSHLFLGVALGLAPLGAWIAVAESINMIPILLAAAVVVWVAGFDVLYSCQDYEVDRAHPQLHSIPKMLGIAGAMRFSRRLHAGALVFFALFWAASGLGLISAAGVVVIAVLLLYQHSLVSPRDLSRINAAFFTANGLISVAFLFLVALDVMGR